jgi:signal transduction histidine kinase
VHDSDRRQDLNVMLVELLFLALVLTVSALISADLAKSPSESPQGQTDGQAHDGFPWKPGRTGLTAAAHDANPPRRLDTSSSAPSSHRRPGIWSAEYQRSRRTLRNWRVRSRLILLAIIPAVAATIVTLSIVLIIFSLQSTSINSPKNSVRDAAVTSVVVACIIVIITVGLGTWSTIIAVRSMLRPLDRLRAGVLQIAGARLHHAARAAGQGGLLGVEPIDVGSTDEIAEIAHAVDQVHREALRLAVSEAALRGRRSAMLVNLSRRSESVAERQLRLLCDLEQGEQDTERLRNLLKVDRLATRMRRHSQNLLVLAGQPASGQLNRPMALVHVIRAAVSEIEDQERVSLNAQPSIAVSAPAIADVVHLLAELAENATSLSPADTRVAISGRRVATGGVLVDVIDWGLGMSADEIAQANWRLDHPESGDSTIEKCMGLQVVARLAARHGIRVQLRPVESGGLAALVWLPDSVILHQDPADPAGVSDSGGARSQPGSLEAADLAMPAE